ncbi:MAG: hypothetical protein ACOYXR_02445 [Nitrospirota bacterium]
MTTARGNGERGLSLIAVIFFVVVMGFLGITLVSLMSTQASTSAGELSSTQALSVAEGGSEFAQRALAQNLDWYRSAADPIVSPATALGAGTFITNTFLPATKLSRRVTSAPGGTIRVFSTARFPAAGVLQLGHDIVGGEFVQYTVANATTFNVVARDVTVGGVNGGAAGTYPRGTAVFPVATLNANLAAVSATCSPTPAGSITIAANSKFLATGTITVDTEEITYTGSSTTAGVATLTGVTRCVNSQSSGALRPAGYPVTPLLDDDSAPDYEVLMMSTGSVGAGPLTTAARVVQKTVQR